MAYVSPTLLKIKNQLEQHAVRTRLADYRGAKLLADGRTALAMRQRGATPTEMLSAIGGSRPRMYKALRAAIDAEQQPTDPLLL